MHSPASNGVTYHPYAITTASDGAIRFSAYSASGCLVGRLPL